MEEQEIEKQEMTKKKKWILCAVAIVILCLIVAGLLFIILNSAERRLSAQLELGQKYLEEMDYEQAIVAYEAAIAIDPKCIDAYLGMAEAYIGMGEYENARESLNKALELGEENERTLDIQRILEEAEQIQVTVTKTEIQADGVFNQEGYGSLTINGVGSLWENWENPESVIPPQKALVDADGNFVFPYQSTYLTYRISDGVVSLTEDSPYYTSDGYEETEYLPAYYNLDGSGVFVSEVVTSEPDEHTVETTWWHCGPMQDGYALVIKHVNTTYWDGFVGAGGFEEISYIMDKNGTITCTLPEEFNEAIADSLGGFDAKYSLGWCGEGLFAVFENHYDEDWNYFSEGKGYLDSAGNMAIDLSGRGFTNLWPFYEGLAAVLGENGMIGFIDKTGELVIPCSYEGVTGFGEGICGVKKDGRWGYINRDGSEVIPFEYDGAYGAGGGLASVVKDGKCGLVDYSNRIIVPLEYDDISSYEGGTAYAIKDGILYIISE
ncbi:MAG: WG repeat-containing protein [Candidatus Gastranaerophilales bacterium]|nr:WG repeat-containing protein [Candidatus Gastranaerophilales bacterium]